jgi:DNA polymerase-1
MKEERLDSKMILQVHDEMVFDVHPSELEKLKVIVSKEMREALPLKVPVEVEMGTGRNWLEAH